MDLDSGIPTPPPPPVTCSSLVQPDGSPTGIEHCWVEGLEGWGKLDRTAVVPCRVEAIDPAAECGGWYGDECGVNGDCGPDAVCDNGAEGCLCTRVCAADADCAAGETCLCDDLERRASWIDHCRAAACETGADCASGACGVSLDGCGFVPEELACRTADDDCSLHSDCPMPQQCRWSGAAGRWTCQEVLSCE